MTALLLVPIAGSIAYSVEQGTWYYFQRSMQNAADSAAIAAASNNKSESIGGTPAYKVEAWAAARKAGFVDGTDNTTVDAAPTACPAGTESGSTCYAATIETILPLTFSSVVGFIGSDAFGSGRGQRVLARAVAITAGGGPGSATSACVWAFDHLQTNGTPKADLTGCSVLSSGTMTCTGDNGVQADYAVAAAAVSGNCASSPTNNLSGQTIPPDPYADMASNIPSTTCGTNPATKGTLSGKLLVYCGNVTLSGDLTLNSPDTVVVIKNGTLDLNNKTLKTASGASATIIFDTAQPPFGDKNMKGTIDIKAPDSASTSAWKGVAIYRKPGGPFVDATLAGSKATWDITGLVYLPNTNVTLDGAVNHSSTGQTCFVLVGEDVTVNGNGQILQTTDGCNTAGLTPPSLIVGGGTVTREKLVQ